MIRFLMAGWPASDILYQEGSLSLRLQHHISDEANLRGLPPSRPSARVERVDPLSVALKFAGATMCPQHDFGVMDANRDLECPLVDTHFQGWKLPPRKVQREGCRDWRMGLRLGPTASGVSTNYARSVAGTPPAMRKTRLQELFCFSHAPGRVGFHPAMTPYAPLGAPECCRGDECPPGRKIRVNPFDGAHLPGPFGSTS